MKSRIEISNELDAFLIDNVVPKMTDEAACKLLAFMLHKELYSLPQKMSAHAQLFETDIQIAATKLNITYGCHYNTGLFQTFMKLYQEIEKSGRLTSWLPEIANRYALTFKF